MKDQVLSIEQMQKLKELGIDDSKASIYWIRQTNSSKCNDPINGKYFLSLSKGDKLMKCGFISYETTPTLTLQDMIELMPNFIKFDGAEYFLCIDNDSTQYSDIEGINIYWSNENGILINTYNVICWLAKNKYI